MNNPLPPSSSIFSDLKLTTPCSNGEDDIFYPYPPSPLRFPLEPTSLFFTNELFSPVFDPPILPPPSPYGDLSSSATFHFQIGVEHGNKFLPQFTLSTTNSNEKPKPTSPNQDQITEMFHRLFLSNQLRKILHTHKPTTLPNNRKKRRHHISSSCTPEIVDHTSMLLECAQAIVKGDGRKAKETLQKLREHSSPLNDDYLQRLSHYFSDAIEARLAGTGAQREAAMAAWSPSPTEMLTIYGDFLPSCPLKVMASYFSMHQLLLLASTARSIHIIDIGIHYGFHWPLFIKALSTRPGSPPLLRITGVEHTSESRELLNQTGSFLHSFCREHRVPFEFIGVGRRWEDVEVEELGMKSSDDVVVVHSQFRLERICDEEVGEKGGSPREAVLKVIKKISPDMCIQHSICGSFGAAEFWGRFREALHHYSALFDMSGSSFEGGRRERWRYERLLWGREIMNVVACEGEDRCVRPKTYKQWEADICGLGFGLVPMEEEFASEMAASVEAGYHRDYMVERDGGWLLLGWKGRILCCSSCWVPNRRRNK